MLNIGYLFFFIVLKTKRMTELIPIAILMIFKLWKDNTIRLGYGTLLYQ